MNSKKRKTDNKAKDCNLNDQKKSKECKDETADVNATDCECGNSKDEQKSDNGGSSKEAKTSDGRNSEDNLKDGCVGDEVEKKPTKVENSDVLGTLLFCGGTNWDLIGRKELPKHAKNATGTNLWGPHRLASLKGIRVRGAFAGCCAVHSVIITENGQAYTWGRNDKGQLGHSDILRRDIPTLVETLKDENMISASCGRGHTLFLSDQGVVYSCGDNKMGQCGTGSSKNVTITTPTKIAFKGRSIAKVACGAEFSIIVDSLGLMYSFGCPEFGQLGHNTDGKYFVTSNKLSFHFELAPRRVIAFCEKTREGHISIVDDVQIVDVACGINHSVAVDSNKRCFTWGFGGYGRLGHAETRDEFIPRLVKTFDVPNPGKGVKKIFAGGTYTMAINIHDVLYFFGQHKRAGEANIYPKPVTDLIGLKVYDAGCANTSIVCVADDDDVKSMVVSWGPSPTFGELGYGDDRPKSSTTPQEVKTLDSVFIHSVTCGYGHTLFIARDDSEEDKKSLEQLPEYSP